METALRKFEEGNPSLCVLIPSEDQFYGASKGSNRLAPHVQWVFVPAAKDITEESQESKSSGLGQLLARTIRSKVDFAEKVAKLREVVTEDYQKMLNAEQSILDDLSRSLERRLKDWAHPDATAKLLWTQDADKTVRVDEPWACIEIGERGFEGELARFGHGMQRSFMLTLLQELTSSNEESAPTLLLAIEEPELYQHPPQARYLAETLYDLSEGDTQVVVCSHSPLFVPGDNFEAVRIVRDSGSPSNSSVTKLSYDDLATDLGKAGQKLLKEKGMLAKLYPALNATLNEMFFCRVLVLVEGLEDLAYVSTAISLNQEMDEFRKCGCHIVAVGGKSELIKPLAMAKQLKIPTYVVFDADTDTNPEKADWINMHKKDNETILALAGHSHESEWPTGSIVKDDMTCWQNNLTRTVEEEIGEAWQEHKSTAAVFYQQPGGLGKNPIAISRALQEAWTTGDKSASLVKLANDIVRFAKNSSA